jgi:IclR family acetate operon transcriptional repressor
MRSEIGKREAVHSTALGKALLASLSTDELQDLMRGYDFTPVTAYTITRPKAFFAELDAIRRRGYAIDDQENEIGGRCVAAVIHDFRGEAAAAISISVPLQRLPDSKIELYGQIISQAAREISQKMGAPQDPSG